MVRLRVLDLFCGAGGAAVGYHRAFTAAGHEAEIVGIDIKAQPNFPFEFFRADALAIEQDILEGCFHENPHKSGLGGRLAVCLGHFDFIHASPPCQGFTPLRWMHNAKTHDDLIGPTRDLLEQTGLSYVIENVRAAPLRAHTMLCGTMFGLGTENAELRRHRYFETNWTMSLVPPSFTEFIGKQLVKQLERVA